jgi:hypothetical protein
LGDVYELPNYNSSRNIENKKGNLD